MNKSDSIKELADALSKAQGELKSAPFNRKNPFLNNRPYADLGSHIEAAKPILAKYGLALSQLVTSVGDQVGVETLLMHKSGEWISTTVTIPPQDEKGKSFAQVAGSIISYFRRYSMAAILGMYSDEEDDGAETGTGTTTSQRPAASTGSGSATRAPAQAAAPANTDDNEPAPANWNGVTMYQKLAEEAQALTKAGKLSVKIESVVPGTDTKGKVRQMYGALKTAVDAAKGVVQPQA